MAPELLAGRPATVASDVYAIGVLLFNVLTAQYPVDGADMHQSIRLQSVKPLKGVARRCAALVQFLRQAPGGISFSFDSRAATR